MTFKVLEIAVTVTKFFFVTERVGGEEERGNRGTESSRYLLTCQERRGRAREMSGRWTKEARRTISTVLL